MTTIDLLDATRLIEPLDERSVRCGAVTVAASALHAAVYQHLYLGRPYDPAAPEDRRLAADREDPAFVAGLRAADGGRRRWRRGWRLDRSDGDRLTLVAAADGVRLTAAPGEVRAVASGVEVAVPTERRFVSAGFYLTTGLAGTGADAGPVLRWYANTTADGAAPLLRALIRDLDAAGLPFTVKTLNDPAAHPRPDALVLYTPRAASAAVAALLRTVLAEPGVRLRPAVPAFTRTVAPGLAIADEPGGALSFGQHRCLLLVRGVLAAGTDASVEERWDRVRTAFGEAGLDPARPHLGPGAAEPDTGTVATLVGARP
ncbi:T3SS effector HopA1 family protein [Jiangella endophytica]|uniref:T3SS effector HopA1 family protein n=1 Tax=Jiangella endophytica TaxID=1623398 RepID=UPI000E353E41|nr:T3SS effector HopA1 family protein [Jiangella endophytica]